MATTKSKETPEQAQKRAQKCYEELDALLSKHRCRLQPKPLFDGNGKLDRVEIAVVPLALE